MSRRTPYLVILAVVATAFVWTSLGAAAENLLANGDFEQGQPGQAPAPWLVRTVSGYDILLSDENPKSGKQCLAIARDPAEPGAMGNVVQRIDAAPLRGKRVRYRAAVRTDVGGQAGTARLWLRVDRPEERGQRIIGFFDNMHDRPISKSAWDYYEIIGDIDEDAETINAGILFSGDGHAWMDDASLEIIDANGDVTGRVLGALPGTSFADIGPGLLEIIGVMEARRDEPSASADARSEQHANVLVPLPLAYRKQVPVTYELTVDPPDAATGISIYQDTPDNYVAKVSVVLGSDRDTVDIEFRSLVLVAPESFESVPSRAEIPDEWPESCRPWLQSTWCVDAQHADIQAVGKEIRDNADDVMGRIAAVNARADKIFATAEGLAKDLTAVEALTGRGSCTSMANLVAALLRASNIPARILAGYPSWSGPLQTHSIVEAYVPEYGWYPIESTLCRFPWPNEYQINVAIIPPAYESKELADWRAQAAGGVPYLSVTEMTDASPDIIVRGTIDRDAELDHQCKMIRKFPTDDSQWPAAFAAATARWQKWLASNPQPTEKGHLLLPPTPDTLDATSPAELLDQLPD